MSKGILIAHLVLICIALVLGAVSMWRNGLFSESEGYLNFQVLGMLCIILSQAILVVVGLYRNKKGKTPIV